MITIESYTLAPRPPSITTSGCAPGPFSMPVARSTTIDALSRGTGHAFLPITLSRVCRPTPTKNNLSGAIQFADIKSAFYKVVRQVVFERNTTDEDLARLVASLQLPTDTMHALHRTLSAGWQQHLMTLKLIPTSRPFLPRLTPSPGLWSWVCKKLPFLPKGPALDGPWQTSYSPYATIRSLLG